MQSLLISSTKKSSGKTIVTIGLSGLATKLGYSVQTFKKGPDFIDPSWLSYVSKRPCFNLDFNTMSPDEISSTYQLRVNGSDIGLIEGTKGLYDGISTDGRDSNAELAKLLRTEVLLVIDCKGITRGIAPLLQGYKKFDSKIKLNQVLLNHVSTSRHEAKLLSAIRQYTDFKVLGAIPPINNLIDERHLGLIPSFQDHNKNSNSKLIISTMKDNVDYKKIYPKKIKKQQEIKERKIILNGTKNLTIGVAIDSAFGFYYPDDLEKIIKYGHKIKKVNLIKDRELPALDGLFIGGGFPETQAGELSKNISMKKSVKSAIENHLPVYAECGGLMYLANNLKFNRKISKMCNVFDIDIIMNTKPIGRGYTILDSLEHPWGIKKKNIHAHEFHYSSVVNRKKRYKYAFDIKRGYGINGKKDGLIYKNTIASFSHLRSCNSFDWIKYFIKHIEEVNGKTNI
jgi:cobyrinic acid a,c-diamide synthase